MNLHPPYSSDSSGASPSEEPFFVISSAVGAALFLFRSAITLLQEPRMELPARVREFFEIARDELPPRSLIALRSSMALLWLPPIVGAAVLLQIWLTRSRALPKAEAGDVRWNIWDVFKVWASSYCFFLVAELAISGVSSLYQLRDHVSVFAANATAHSLIIIALCLYVARQRGDTKFLSARLPLTKIPPNLLSGLKGFLLTAPFSFAAVNLSALLFWLAGKEKAVDTLIVYMFDAPAAHLWILVPTAVVLVPLAEETLFRGFLYPVLERRSGRRAAIVLSALVFAAFHLNPYNFLPILAIGIGLGYTYSRTRSIAACFAFHGAVNGVSAASTLLLRAAVS